MSGTLWIAQEGCQSGYPPRYQRLLGCSWGKSFLLPAPLAGPTFNQMASIQPMTDLFHKVGAGGKEAFQNLKLLAGFPGPFFTGTMTWNLPYAGTSSTPHQHLPARAGSLSCSHSCFPCLLVLQHLPQQRGAMEKGRNCG